MVICLGTTPAIQRSMTFARLQVDDVNRAAAVSHYASGKSINAARVLHALAVPVLAMGFAGGDPGRSMLLDLQSADIPDDFVIVPPPTRMCITLIDQATGTATELIEEAAFLPVDAFDQLLLRFEARLAGCNGVVLSGSLPRSAPVNFYQRCVRMAAASGKTVVLDASGPPLQHALAERPTVVKPNRQELAITTGQETATDLQLKQAISALIASGPRWVVVTDGPRPTIVSDGQQFFRVTAPPVAVISAIGSGDSFAAGLAAGLARGWEMPRACALAAACGSANAMTHRAGFLSIADVQRLENDVQVTPF